MQKYYIKILEIFKNYFLIQKHNFVYFAFLKL